jgi:uncharacterized protein YkvS
MISEYQVTYYNATQTIQTWPSIPGVLVLKDWAKELKKVVSQGNVDESIWRLISKAAVMLHDKPQLCRDLAKLIAQDAQMNFIELSADEILDLVTQNHSLESYAPALIYVHGGPWYEKVSSENSAESASIIDFQKSFSSYLENLNPNHPIVFLTSIKKYEDLSEEIRKVGGIDRRFYIPPMSIEDIGKQFISKIGENRCDSSLINFPEKVGKLIDNHFDDERRQGLVLLALQRKAYFQSRLVTFHDLVDLAAHGSHESDLLTPESNKTNLNKRKKDAIHEAGHALISIIDSEELNIPDYCSIISMRDYSGMMLESFSYNYDRTKDRTYRNLRHQIRIALGGRAAEHVMFGIENVNAWGSESDLLFATFRAKQLMGNCGFSPDCENDIALHNNLAIFEDNPTPSEAQHIEALSRQFLATQYEAVLEMINSNKNLLKLITDQLLRKQVLYQPDFLEIMKEKNLLQKEHSALESA